MSRNNKNARLQKLEEALPKNRSAAARARRAEGKVKPQARATPAQHGKKNAWWQKPGATYAEYIKGGGKKKRGPRPVEGGDASIETSIDTEIKAELV